MGIIKTAKDVVRSYAIIKTNRKLTYEELYAMLSSTTFSAGIPAITGSRLRCIRFPEQDGYHIQVAISGCSVKINKVYGGVSGMLEESTANAVVSDWKNTARGRNQVLKNSMDELAETLEKLLEKNGYLK